MYTHNDNKDTPTDKQTHTQLPCPPHGPHTPARSTHNTIIITIIMCKWLAAMDFAPMDTAPVDVMPLDTPMDVIPMDVTSVDVMPLDTPMDVTSVDAMPLDTPMDVTSVDVMPLESFQCTSLQWMSLQRQDTSAEGDLTFCAHLSNLLWGVHPHGSSLRSACRPRKHKPLCLHG